jgi:hypothetical protein
MLGRPGEFEEAQTTIVQALLGSEQVLSKPGYWTYKGR